jgi:hypothetical protein
VQAIVSNRFVVMASGNPMFMHGGVVLRAYVSAAIEKLHDVLLDIRR